MGIGSGHGCIWSDHLRWCARDELPMRYVARFTALTLISIFGPAITTLSMYIYTHKLVILDEDDFAPLDVMKEGFMPALGMFLATWILVYTQLHGIGAAE